MAGVLEGFAVIATVILGGYIVGRLGILGEHSEFVLSRIVFFVLSPCLLLTVLADADVHTLFSSHLLVAALAAIACFIVYSVIATAVLHRQVADVVIGALGSGYVNGNYIGIPVALYVLGDASLAAPIVLVQLLLFAPVALSILDATTRGSVSIGSIALGIVRNPLIIASALGTAISVSGIDVPEVVFEPFRMIGAAAVPTVLLSFGAAFAGSRLLAPGDGRADIAIASIIKLLIMPTFAWLLGRFVFGLSGIELFAPVILAALPSAQNVFNYAQRYERGVTLARDVVFVTTVLSMPVLLVIAWLLAT
jgi:malonate transporter and related proteins